MPLVLSNNSSLKKLGSWSACFAAMPFTLTAYTPELAAIGSLTLLIKALLKGYCIGDPRPERLSRRL
jgi:hypothetical protein